MNVTATAQTADAEVRIGVILPSGNTVAERELAAMVPAHVSTLTTRLRLRGTGSSPSVQEVQAMVTGTHEAAQMIGDGGPSVVLFHCTGATALAGDALIERVSSAAGCPATTTAEAIAVALHTLDVSCPVLVSPYPEAINDGEVAYFAEHDIKVVRSVALDIHPIERWSRLEPGFWFDAGRDAVVAGADSVVLSCTNIRAAAAIEALERECQLPVVSSNQAGIWNAMRIAQVDEPVAGYGRLLADVPGERDLRASESNPASQAVSA